MEITTIEREDSEYDDCPTLSATASCEFGKIVIEGNEAAFSAHTVSKSHWIDAVIEQNFENELYFLRGFIRTPEIERYFELDGTFQECVENLKVNLTMDDVQKTLEYIEKHWML